MPLLFVVVALLLAAPALAAPPEKVSTLPTIAPVSSGRIDFATRVSATVDGQPAQATLVVGRGEFTQRGAHLVAISSVDGSVAEVVVYGDLIYVRMNNETRWKSTKVTDATNLPVDAPTVPTAPGDQMSIYLIGDQDVRGVPTTQYQLQLDPALFPAESGIKSAHDDLFIGKSDSFLHKVQTTVGGTDKDLGDITIEAPVDLYDLNNAAIVVGPPPADLVTVASAQTARSLTGFAGALALPSWVRPFVGSTLANLRAGR